MQVVLLFGLLAGGYFALRYFGYTKPVEHKAQSIAEQLPVVGEYFVSETAIQRIAHAIATAEGFFVPGSRPNRNNNPGDLKGNYAGTAVGNDAGFDVYATPDDGWAALYRQVTLWLTNKSHVANQDTTLYELSRLYTTTDQDAWLNNVASQLGVDPSTSLSEVA